MKTGILALLALARGLHAADTVTADEAAMKRFIEAWRIIEENTADPADTDQAFYHGAIPGLLRHLDPHSVFFPPDQFQQLKAIETSVRKRFGTVVSILPGRVGVLQTLPTSPSDRAGMMRRDEILAASD